MAPGERWLAIDAEDTAHMWKTCLDPDGATFASLDWDPGPGEGGGSGLDDAVGPLVVAYTTETPSPPELVEPEAFAAAFNLALVSSSDPEVDTLSTVSDAIADLAAIGVTDLTSSVHGFFPPAVLREPILRRIQALHGRDHDPRRVRPDRRGPPPRHRIRR